MTRGFTLSPDDRRVAYVSHDLNTTEFHIYVYDLSLGVSRRLTFNSERNNHAPAWSPDGRMIAFYSSLEGTTDIHVKLADGSGNSHPVIEAGIVGMGLSDWSDDGRYLVYSRLGGKTAADIEYASLQKNNNSITVAGVPQVFLQTP